MLPTTKALPNRQPETAAAKHANRMMSHGGAPLPVKTIQQVRGVFCPTCGEHHRPGKTCGVKSLSADPILKALEDHTKDAFFKALRSQANASADPLFGFFDSYFAKGKVGNPYPHDPKTGHFGKKPSAGGGGGGDSGMAKLTGGGSGGAAPTASAGPATQPSAPPSIGTANTIQAPAPTAAATPTTGSAGPPTAAGKAPAQDSGQKTGVGIAPKRAQANQARREGMQQEASAKQDAATAGLSAKLGGDAPRQAGEAAYFKHRDEALAGGASEAQAHEVGKQRGSEAWDQAVSARDSSKLPAPTSSGAKPIPGGVAPATMQAGAPSGMGQAQNPTSIPLSPPSAPIPATGSGGAQLPAAGTTTPGAPSPTAPTEPTTPGTPGAKKPAGGKPGAAGGMNPWSMYGVGGGIGGGMFTPGGTVNATAGGAVTSAHSLLHGGGGQQQKPAAVGRAARVEQAAKPPKAPKPKGGGQSSMQVSP